MDAASHRPVRFLIDNALSPILAEQLRQNGHDAIHVRDCRLRSATDEQIFTRAADENRIGSSSLLIPISELCLRCDTSTNRRLSFSGVR
jgi:hypothetical protein